MKKKSFKSVISIILAIIMLIQVLPVSAIYAAATSLTPIDLGTVSVNDVYILTNNQFVSTSDVQTGTGNGYQLAESTSSTAKKVYVGDNTYSGTAYAANSDISVEIAGTDKNLSLLDILPVNKGTYTVNANVSKDSKIATLKLEKNAKLTLNLEAALTVEKVELESGSELIVNANKENFKITGDTTGAGSITVSGDNISVHNTSVGSFVANKATVDANGNSISAINTLSVNGSTISNADFFGYGDSAKGDKILSFKGNGNIISNVDAVGVMPNGIATVFVEGTNTITQSSNTNYYFDYAVNYKYDGNIIDREDNWVASYRVKYAGTVSSSTSSIIGYHEQNGAYNNSSDITLPEYTVEGYNYVGWIVDGSDKAITSVPANSTSVLDLTVSLEIGTTLLTCDLGFTPSADTNDDYKNMHRVYDYTVQWNSDITLQRPVRFGYVFDGWKVTTGKNKQIHNDTYKVALSDADKNGSNYNINLEAQWSAKSFPLRFLINTADVNQMKVKVGSTTYDSITAFANANSNVSWDSKGQLLQFSNINYGETIEDYFTRMNYSDIPELIDTRTGKEKVDFAGWTTPGGALVSPEMTFSIGSLLDNRSGDESLKAYESQITTTPAVLTSSWGTAKYKLTVDIVSGWDVLVDGEVQSASAVDKITNAITGKQQMSISVPVGSTVSFRTLVSANSNFSLWNFTDGFMPVEGKYSASLQYLTYTAQMPNKNVNASFSDVAKMYVDLSQSNITMQQNVTLPSGRIVDGFWYGIDMIESSYDSMTINAMTPAFQQSSTASEHAGEYFYIWNYSNALRVTTRDIATTNRLTLVNAINLYLKDCNMTATEAYKALSGTTFEGVELENLNEDIGAAISKNLANADFSKYANIFIDNSSINSYNITLTIQGDNNSISCISTNGFHYALAYQGVISVVSEDSNKKNLSLGTYIGDFRVYSTRINYKQIDNLFNYIFYTSYSGCLNFTSCDFYAKDKTIFSFSNSTIEYSGSTCYIKELRNYYYGLRLSGKSYGHIYGDMISNRATIGLTGDSSLVVDGNVLTTYHDQYSSSTINTTGYFIIKGNVYDSGNLYFSNGTIICNDFVVGSLLDFKNNAVLVANIITNAPYSYISYDKSKGRYYPLIKSATKSIGALSSAKSNEDDHPFLTYSCNSPTKKNYNFAAPNGSVYLLGYYNVDSSNYYDISINATDINNPVKTYIDACLDDNGDIVSSPKLDENALKDYVKKSTSTNECIILGNSLYNSSSPSYRSANFSGSNVYAAGNITMYNDTTVSGGNITCSGDFGSKLNLNITGGTINAKTVGNVQNIALTGGDSTKTWNKTTISGGTVNAETIGARDSYGTKGTAQCSLVEISGGTVDNSKVRSDEYINYVYNTSDFPANVNSFSSMPNNIRFENTCTSSSLGTWSTVGIDSFTKPKLADRSEGSWLFDSLNGQEITSVDSSGAVLPKEETVEYAYGKDKLMLYAVKQKYTLTRVYGTEYYDIQVGDTTPSFSNSTMTDIGDLSTISVKKLDVNINTNITLSLSDRFTQYKSRLIVWYVDGNGLYHNAIASSSWNDNNQISFKMPKGNCFIYIVDDNHALPLDLWVSGFTFTKDGFITEFTDTRDSNGNFEVSNSDRVFTYSGDYKIVQSNIKSTDITESSLNYQLSVSSSKITSNRIYFAKDFVNTSDNSKIIVSRVYQTCPDSIYGVILENDTVNKIGAQVKIQLDGKIALFRYNILEYSSLDLIGINGPTSDLLYFNRPTANTPSDYLVNSGTYSGKTGDVKIENVKINLRSGYGGYILYAGTKSGSLLIKDCVFNRQAWGDSTLIACNITDVTIDNSSFDITNGSGYTTQLFNNVDNVYILNNSNLKWLNIGSINTGGYPIEYSVKNSIVFDNSTYTTTYDPNCINSSYMVNDYSYYNSPKVILQNNAQFNADNRYRFNSVEIKSDAQLNINLAEQNDETYLFSKDILVDGGEINCDNVIVSGFYDNYSSSTANHAETKAQLDNYIKNKDSHVVNGANYSGLVVKSGTVNAKKFVGGSYSAKITVSGDGVINSPAIGTNGKLYGYVTVLPQNLKDYVYSYNILDYSNYTQSATVTVNGGTINVLDGGYVGGMNANVYTNGGSINLSDGSVIGITDEQIQALTTYYLSKGDDISNHKATNIKVTLAGGSVEVGDDITANIYTPYGNTIISGNDTKVKVSNILADKGSITIQGTNSAYTNPYSGTEQSKYKSTTVGVWVNDTLSGENVTINANAQVYANNAYAVIDSDGNGRLTVDGAGLYSNAYGEKGINRNSADKAYNDTPNALLQTVFGTHMVTITYDLNPQGDMFDYDVASVTNNNVLNYTVTGTATTIDLSDAACEGYYFRGWYNNANYDGDAVTSLNTTIANDLTLYAKWEKITVSFVLFIDKNSTEYYAKDEFDNNSGWVAGDGGYYSTKVVNIKYGDKILTTNGVNLIDFTTNTLGVTELAIKEDDYANSGAINTNSIVTKELAEFYRNNKLDSNSNIKLYVSRVQKRYALITFLLNKQDGKPTDAAYANGANQLQANISVNKELSTLDTIVDTNATGNSKGIIQAKAIGYTFVGWNTDKNATMTTTTGWINDDSSFTANTTAYAIWQANTYLIRFNADSGSWVTKDNEVPTVGSPEAKTLDYYWIYDTFISDKNSFWLKNADTHEHMDKLPYAWKEGSKFDETTGWNYSVYIGQEPDATLIAGTVSNTTELTKLAVSALDTAVGDANGNPTTVALELFAQYTQVQVTYNLNGGKWTDSSSSLVQYPDYDSALEGYTTSTVDTDTNVTADSTGENGKHYYVADTKAEYFADNSKYVADDYRNALNKKGYTFYGWYDTEENANKLNGDTVGTTPRFNDISLYAGWKANSYTVNINNKDSNKTYNYTAFNDVSPAKGINVTVGQEINDSKWPGRSGNWYAYNSNAGSSITENAKRYFLGATFAPLDPGSTVSGAGGYDEYINYAQAVTSMINDSTLYQNHSGQTDGTVFFLPEDNIYSNDIKVSYGSDYSVADYPQGSTIKMYAVYRERSLVFVERYIDPLGNVQENVKYSDAWNEWSNYPEKYGKNGNSDITRQGYSLIGWYVNGITTSATPYPTSSTAYDNVKESFKTAAENIGTYDIMVYTVYAAQVSRDVVLQSKSDPTDNNLPSDAYLMPSSMQNGVLSVLLDNLDSKLNIVSKNELESHKYDLSWTAGNKTYNSDDTVALTVTASKDNVSKTMDCGSDLTSSLLKFETEVESGWQIMFTLYHSKVVTSNNEYSFDLTAKFNKNGDNTLKDQFIKNHIIIRLQPSVYTVNYTVTLPEAQSKLTVNDWGYFSAGGDNDTVITKQVSMAYNAALTDKKPQIEGYSTTSSWKYDKDNADYTKLNMRVSEVNNGIINVSTSYNAISYSLFADEDTLKNWNITYTDGALSNTQIPLSNTKVNVKYHSAIKFVLKTQGVAASPEFITLTLYDGSKQTKIKLPEYALLERDVYSFTMPAMNIEAMYITVETLYLDDGTISITPTGYTHSKATGDIVKNWPGDYVILQNASNDSSKATANVLNLSGDLSDRTIKLGNLNINSDNSINLNDAVSSNVSLTLNYKNDTPSSLNIKNINVSDNSIFNIKSLSSANSTIVASPKKNIAAIGSNSTAKANGKITAHNISFTVNMPAGSSASGIGASSSNANAGETISLNNCILNLSEGSDTQVYSGSWIGGNGVTKVNLNNVEVNRVGDKHMSGPTIICADDVNIDNSTIGSSSYPVFDPIYAKSSITINDSQIYQNIQDNIVLAKANAPLSTDNGKINVNNSVINAIKTGTISAIADLYTGTLYINDAKSEVYIDGTQIVEVANGSITVDSSAYTQNSVSHNTSSNRNYLLIEELNKPSVDPNLTVNALGNDNTITVKYPNKGDDIYSSTNGIYLGKLVLNCNTNIELNSNLFVSSTATIKSENTLTVNADAIHNPAVNFTSNDNVFADTTDVSYIQNNGAFNSTADLGNGNINVTFSDVDALVKNLVANNLTITNSSKVNATGSQIGSKPASTDNATNVTDVIIKDSTVSAANVGALGEYDKTFTNVSLSNSNVDGTVVKDNYRLTYDKSNSNVNTDSLSIILRSSEVYSNGTVQSTAYLPANGIPANPTGDTNFYSWYINWCNNTDTQEYTRKALTNGQIPAGLKDKTTLVGATVNNVVTKDSILNSDGTKTLVVHAWVKATGNVNIKNGRNFVISNDYTLNTITVQNNAAWTVKITSTGTFIDNRDYRVTFGKNLPVNSKLTLTVPTKNGVNDFYYYIVSDDNTTSVKFSEFSKMGSNDKFDTTLLNAFSADENETFLLSADFKYTSGAIATNENVSIDLIPSEGSTDVFNIGNVTYSLSNASNGVIAANGDSVKITSLPNDSENLSGKKIYLKATLTDANDNDITAKYDVKATYGDIVGKWTSKNEVRFELGDYDSISSETFDKKYLFENLENGTYTVRWSLIACDSNETNKIDGLISNETTVSYVINVAENSPYMSVTANSDNRVITQGSAKSITFNYVTDSENVKIFAEKQTTLCNFTDMGNNNQITYTVVKGSKNSDGMNTGSVTVNFASTLAEESYRIRFSMNDLTDADDCYFTYVVKTTK